jgi:hypothetical protein
MNSGCMNNDRPPDRTDLSVTGENVSTSLHEPAHERGDYLPWYPAQKVQRPARGTPHAERPFVADTANDDNSSFVAVRQRCLLNGAIVELLLVTLDPVFR